MSAIDQQALPLYECVCVLPCVNCGDRRVAAALSDIWLRWKVN